jgi:hypothetical protein
LGEERECRRRTGRFQKAALASRGEKYIGRRRSKLYRSRGHSVFDRWSVECKFNFIYITQIHQYDEVGEEEKEKILYPWFLLDTTRDRCKEINGLALFSLSLFCRILVSLDVVSNSRRLIAI